MQNFVSQNIDNSNKLGLNEHYPNKKNAVLIFSNKDYLIGYGIGKTGITTGEICFNTAITGYQEILTDPSYSGQIINFTFPHIGNVGTNNNDIEGNLARASGLIIRENITNPSNYRSQEHFNQWLVSQNLIGICGVDTRLITKIIRQNGARTIAIIHFSPDEEINQESISKIANQINNLTDLKGVELASKASENKHYKWINQGKWSQENNQFQENKSSIKLKVTAIDYGAKLNILRCLTESGCDVEILPANSKIEDILKTNPDGVFLSNGPGDPFETSKYTSSAIQEIIKRKIPLFGICLGHQLLAIAIGAKTIKMNQGHRGANHPVQNLKTKKVEITSQNHGFAVEASTIPSNAEITHISLFDGSVEGLKLKDAPAFSVQYHPESSPGPSDSYYLFQDFINLMKESKNFL
ncbi:MAG: glutamine-hydrolyzing carbamoyl-phosphate synthase small subunit [Rickettsiales bacterium]|jgi:carbamoyl-phosphate synthase small subunit|nr:glutamine-hydrolyzing carbamoyl-phosphate synthase small subunit [Rickettsiales bacterium]